MATSPAEIAQMALSRCGVRKRIVALTDETEEARLCNLHYTLAKEAALAEYEWPFATRRATLQMIKEKPNKEWRFQYALPVDCIEPIYVEGMQRNLPTELRPRWTLESDNETDRTTLMTDEPFAVLKYTSRKTTEGVFPYWFTPVVVWHLADLLAVPLTVSTSTGITITQQLARAIAHATSHAANQGQADDEPENAFVRARD